MGIQKGDKVKVHYTGKLEDGSEFDSSKDREPLAFTVGDGMLIPGFENAVIGRNPGETVRVSISPQDGYGDADPELIFNVPTSQLPQSIPREAGTRLQLSSEQGHQMDVVITKITPEETTLDANHPLAGKTLNFEIEILEAKPSR